MTSNAYGAYLRSTHWRRLRERYRRQRPWRCGVCETSGALELHHKTYERLGAEQLDDLIPLCQSCHPLLHQLEREKQTTLDPASAFNPARAQPFVPPPFEPKRSTPRSQITEKQPSARQQARLQPWQEALSPLGDKLREQERRRKGRRR